MILFLNWLVQGSGLTLIVAGGVSACRTMNAATREVVWWATAGAVLAMPFVSAWTTTTVAGLRPSTPLPPDLLIQLPQRAESWLPWIVTAWIAWVGVWLFGIGTALVRLRRAKRQAAPLAANRERCLPTWIALGGRGRPTRLVVSEHVRNAALLGLGEPLIALAPESLERLTDEELDYVVLHEYAHVQRRDDVAVLIQRLIWAVAGLHPAIWWLDRALTIEREVACDDWVVARTRSARSYAACLVKIAVGGRATGWSLAPRAGLSRALVTLRVTHLLDPRWRAPTGASMRQLVAVLPATAGLFAFCLAAPLVELEPGLQLPARRLAMIQPIAPLANEPIGKGGEGFVLRGPSPQPTRRAPVSTSNAAARIQPVQQGALGMIDVGAPSPAPTTPAPGVLPATRFLSQPVVLPAIRLLSPDVVLLPGGRERMNGDEPTTRVALHAALPAAVQDPTYPGGMSAWKAAANAGVTIGGASRDAAIEIAGFFSRAGKSIGGAF